MSKRYSIELKIKVVNEYLTGDDGFRILEAKYNINRSLIRTWLYQFKNNGVQGLTAGMTRSTYEVRLESGHSKLSETVESSTLDWTTPMREVIVKSMKVGVFSCQEREEHLPLNLNYRWSDYLKMVNQNLKLCGSMISRLQL